MNNNLETWTLDALLSFARTATREIKAFQPQLIIALAHGSWAPLRALQTYWQETQAKPFPSLLVTNIGREKPGHTPAGPLPFCGHYADLVENGVLLAQLEKQTSWLEELRQQVASTLGKDAYLRKIYMLDDGIFEAGTAYIAQGLIQIAFPNVEIQMTSLDAFEWRYELAAPWLTQHNIDLDTISTSSNHQTLDIWEIAPGTEDVHPQSLAWQPLSLENPIIQQLSTILPAEEWLELPKYIAARIAAYVRDNINKPDGELPQDVIRWVRIPREVWVFKYMAQHGRISFEQVVAILGTSPKTAEGLLAEWVDHHELEELNIAGQRMYTLCSLLSDDWICAQIIKNNLKENA